VVGLVEEAVGHVLAAQPGYYVPGLGDDVADAVVDPGPQVSRSGCASANLWTSAAVAGSSSLAAGLGCRVAAGGVLQLAPDRGVALVGVGGSLGAFAFEGEPVNAALASCSATKATTPRRLSPPGPASDGVGIVNGCPSCLRLRCAGER
jgi:hypothetical protein